MTIEQLREELEALDRILCTGAITKKMADKRKEELLVAAGFTAEYSFAEQVPAPEAKAEPLAVLFNGYRFTEFDNYGMRKLTPADTVIFINSKPYVHFYKSGPKNA